MDPVLIVGGGISGLSTAYYLSQAGISSILFEKTTRLGGLIQTDVIQGCRLEAGERCASTSNRNFEGRQGAGGRTHLVSPTMAAAAAIAGHFVDVRRLG